MVIGFLNDLITQLEFQLSNTHSFFLLLFETEEKEALNKTLYDKN